MIRKMLISLSVTMSLFGASNIVSIDDNVKHLKKFSKWQNLAMKKANDYAKEDNLGLTMSAICWLESQAGTQLVNLGDPSFGRYHNLLSSVLNRVGVRDTLYYRNKYANKLMTDHEFSSSQSLAELLYWRSYHMKRTGKDRLWQKTIRSYNAGGNWRGEEAKAYFKNISNKVKALQRVKYFKGI